MCLCEETKWVGKSVGWRNREGLLLAWIKERVMYMGWRKGKGILYGVVKELGI